jgi:hypothetical protein
MNREIVYNNDVGRVVRLRKTQTCDPYYEETSPSVFLRDNDDAIRYATAIDNCLPAMMDVDARLYKNRSRILKIRTFYHLYNRRCSENKHLPYLFFFFVVLTIFIGYYCIPSRVAMVHRRVELASRSLSGEIVDVRFSHTLVPIQYPRPMESIINRNRISPDYGGIDHSFDDHQRSHDISGDNDAKYEKYRTDLLDRQDGDLNEKYYYKDDLEDTEQECKDPEWMKYSFPTCPMVHELVIDRPKRHVDGMDQDYNVTYLRYVVESVTALRSVSDKNMALVSNEYFVFTWCLSSEVMGPIETPGVSIDMIFLVEASCTRGTG